ncbi:hypothetical protein N7533_009078 [Penicillium manginii]|uniref:uncharacterized protein n=1 Tax=Penicillium manginii TaxID=203109 RepID=UPI00254871D3|nr:uncharacterized protein N7533_009078 [Penicillium manginii]KAJ5744208.1 hypothetical protein N7533_009078 [Penicillium manginii]
MEPLPRWSKYIQPHPFCRYRDGVRTFKGGAVTNNQVRVASLTPSAQTGALPTSDNQAVITSERVASDATRMQPTQVPMVVLSRTQIRLEGAVCRLDWMAETPPTHGTGSRP